MSEMQRVNAVLESKGRRWAWTILLILLLVASVMLNLALWWTAHERAMSAELEAASLAQQVQAECEAGGTLSVDGADLCQRADDVAEHTENVTPPAVPIPGPSGPPGADGRDGRNGVDGEDGQDGEPGADGTNGVDGADGIDGQDGANGLDGAPGATGATGPEGPEGKPGPTCPGGYSPTELTVLTRTQDAPEWRQAVLCTPTTPEG